MKKLLQIAMLLAGVAWCVPARATITIGTASTSGGESASSVASVTTGAFSLTAGQLIFCLGRNGAAGTQTWTPSDLAGNTWTKIGSQTHTTIGISQQFYSFTTIGNASDTVKLTYGTNTAFGTIVCWSATKTLSTWNVDATPAMASGTATSMTSASFTTAQAVEIVFGAGTSSSDPTYTTGAIGGTTATAVTSNGATHDNALDYRITASTITAGTAAIGMGQSLAYQMWAASFYESSPAGAATMPPAVY